MVALQSAIVFESMELTGSRLASAAIRLFSFNCAAAAIILAIRAGTGDGIGALTPETVFSTFVYSSCVGTFVGLAVLSLTRSLPDDTRPLTLLLLTIGIGMAASLGCLAAYSCLFLFALSGGSPSDYLPLAVLISFVFGFSAYFYRRSQDRLGGATAQLQQRALDLSRAETQMFEAQFASLTSRVRPHFLFNALNSISALIREEPQMAEDFIDRLSRLLRYSLYLQGNRPVSLSRELELTSDYLAIEQVRFGERLAVKWSIDSTLDGVLVPPFVIQTLAENSIKHVLSKRIGHVNIGISTFSESDNTVIEVTDDGPGFEGLRIIEGHGLDLVRKRLETLYQKSVEMQVSNGANGGACIRMILPSVPN